MTSNFYKQVALSQLIITGWILYALFDHLIVNERMFKGFGLYFFFLQSCIWISGVGLLLGILRLTWFRKNYMNFLSEKFIYVLTGVFNAYLVVIWIIVFSLGLMDFYYFSIGSLLVSLFSAVIILKDFYMVKRGDKSDSVID